MTCCILNCILFFTTSAPLPTKSKGVKFELTKYFKLFRYIMHYELIIMNYLSALFNM